jgi:hypothetical protein
LLHHINSTEEATMKAFTNKTKAAATIMVSLAAVTGTALAHQASAREVPSSDLHARVVQLGEVRGFWSVDCPIAVRGAAAWAQSEGDEAAALDSEGFAIGVQEPLRSASGDVGVSVGLRFSSPAGATADLNRRKSLAGRGGSTTDFAVPGSRNVHAYVVRGAGSTTVHVAFTRGADEYALAVRTLEGANVPALERALATAVTRVAGAR